MKALIIGCGRVGSSIALQLQKEDWDVTVEGRRARLAAARGDAEAVLTADTASWERIADDVASGMDAFRRGRLSVRRNLHLGVGFLAATAP